MDIKIKKKRKKLSKKEIEKRKLAKSIKNKIYYSKCKREKDILDGKEPEPELTKEDFKKKTIRKKVERGLFMVSIASHKKCLDEQYKFTIESNAYKKYNEMVKESEENVVFPVKHISNKNIAKGVIESDYEILLLKVNKNGNNISKLRNEYGKLVDNIVSDNNKWIILDKHVYYKEESFWIYGFNPKTQRKNFNYILNDMILSNSNNKDYFKRILIFKNKLIIQYDFDIDLIICKNQDDVIRLYNELEKKVKEKKIKNIFFNGIVAKSNVDWAISSIMNKTGWNKTKVTRYATDS